MSQPRKPWSKADDHGRLRGRALQRVRREVLTEEPLCRHCMEQGRVTVAVQVDHVISLARWVKERRPGDPYQRSNLQPLCEPCHEVKTAKEQGRRPPPAGVDARGRPKAADHPWNR